MNEHRNIEKALSALELMANAFEAEGRIEPRAAGRAVEFLREYADRLHHGKEEATLFPAMEARGIPSEVGPTAVMRREHTMGRAFTADMADALGADDAPAFVAAAREYVALLREHIQKEDQVLFPMADGLLPPEEQARLADVFDRFDSLEFGRDRAAALLAAVEEVCAKYGVTEAPRKHGTPCGHCCGH
jgi:hemerythrin-like domain-containing protein